jgi:hypothetical protein
MLDMNVLWSQFLSRLGQGMQWYVMGLGVCAVLLCALFGKRKSHPRNRIGRRWPTEAF